MVKMKALKLLFDGNATIIIFICVLYCIVIHSSKQEMARLDYPYKLAKIITLERVLQTES